MADRNEIVQNYLRVKGRARPPRQTGPSPRMPALRVLGEPGAGKPHARFDEGVLVFEHGRAREAPPDERGGNG
jgi:hypothetical protein